MRALKWPWTRVILAAAASGSAGCSDGGMTGGGGSVTTPLSGGGGGIGGGTDRPPAGEDFARDILTTDLELDLTTLVGKATITLAGSMTSQAASFEIGDLEVTNVEDAAGPLEIEVKVGPHGSQLNVGVPSSEEAVIVVEYTFQDHSMFDGWMASQQVSFLWPYFCGNLFPCKSDPADGFAFTLKVTGVEEGMTAVFPTSIRSDAPSYMPAIAVGDFSELDLGETQQGTQISAWHLPGQEDEAVAGTARLKDVFDFFEQTYGDYTFGTSAGSVSANWGPGAYGGMEHHPYWHVAKDDFASETVHAHEAAHGWFGNGVRVACWEDFVLSEGTVSYMAAHALAELSLDVWPDYECQLEYVCNPANGANTVALPEGCNEIDILNDPLWSSVPYMKGAYFFREVAEAIGVSLLDTAIAAFYATNVGQAAKMQALIDLIKSKTDAAGAQAVDDLALAWLRTLECPVDYTTLCL